MRLSCFAPCAGSEVAVVLSCFAPSRAVKLQRLGGCTCPGAHGWVPKRLWRPGCGAGRSFEDVVTVWDERWRSTASRALLQECALLLLVPLRPLAPERFFRGASPPESSRVVANANEASKCRIVSQLLMLLLCVRAHWQSTWLGDRRNHVQGATGFDIGPSSLHRFCNQ